MTIKKLNYMKDGECKTRGKLYAIFADHGSIIRRLPLFSDRKASEEAARKVEKLVSLRAANEMLPPELTRWIETTTPFIRGKLAEYGIIAAARLSASKCLSDHIAEWKASLTAKGVTPRQAELVASRTSKVFDACKFIFWSDISAARIQTHLHELRKNGEGISAQTYNHYLRAVKQFCRWCVREGRASESALAHLQTINVKVDRRHDRRALSVDELRWIIETTRNGPQRKVMTGPERASLYRLAVETGLRAGELRSLTRASFNLDGLAPTVTIEAAYAKNRRRDTLPLRTDLANTLQEILASKLPQALAFAVPIRTEVSRMWKADLEAARQAWLAKASTPEDRHAREQTSFLTYADDAGHFADFHALRHTFISNLVAGNVHPKLAQQLARHGTIGLTMDRYTHVYRGDLAAAVNVLPDLSAGVPEIQKATGTDEQTALRHVSVSVSPGGGFRESSVESRGGNGNNSDFNKTQRMPGNLTELSIKDRVRNSLGEVAERLNAPVSKTG